MDIPKALKPFLDEDGRLTAWPAKHSKKRIAVEYLASKIERGERFTESEINYILKLNHTFGDHATLRRELYVHGYLNRTTDGRSYWRTEK